MDSSDILKEINKQLVRVTNNEAIVLSKQSTAGEIPEWDSLTHIQLIVELEKCFKIKFTSTEISNWKNTGDIIQSIQSKIKC